MTTQKFKSFPKVIVMHIDSSLSTKRGHFIYRYTMEEASLKKSSSSSCSALHPQVYAGICYGITSLTKVDEDSTDGFVSLIHNAVMQ